MVVIFRISWKPKCKVRIALPAFQGVRAVVDVAGAFHVRSGSRPCENSNARRARRNILEKFRVMRTNNAADIRLVAMLENYIFYISRMYEFSHSLGHKRTFHEVQRIAALPLKADIRGRICNAIWLLVFESTPFCNGPDEVKSPDR